MPVVVVRVGKPWHDVPQGCTHGYIVEAIRVHVLGLGHDPKAVVRLRGGEWKCKQGKAGSTGEHTHVSHASEVRRVSRGAHNEVRHAIVVHVTTPCDVTAELVAGACAEEGPDHGAVLARVHARAARIGGDDVVLPSSGDEVEDAVLVHVPRSGEGAASPQRLAGAPGGDRRVSQGAVGAAVHTQAG